MLGAAPDRPAARRRPHHHQGLPRGSDTAQASIDRNHANAYNRMIENEMAIVSRMTEAAPWFDERHGPLPALLLVLTVVTGLVDAVSYLKLGHVFVANMTGNVVFLGFAVADAQDFSIAASLVAIAAFLAGALAGGRLGSILGQHRGRLLATTTYIKIALVGAALGLSINAPDIDGS